MPVQCDQQWFFLLELYLSTNIWFVDKTVTDSSLRYSISVIFIPFFPPEIPFIPQWIVVNVFLAAYHWDHSASLDWKLWAKLVNIWTPQGCCVRPQSMEWCGDTSLYFMVWGLRSEVWSDETDPSESEISPAECWAGQVSPGLTCQLGAAWTLAQYDTLGRVQTHTQTHTLYTTHSKLNKNKIFKSILFWLDHSVSSQQWRQLSTLSVCRKKASDAPVISCYCYLPPRQQHQHGEGFGRPHLLQGLGGALGLQAGWREGFWSASLHLPGELRRDICHDIHTIYQ